MLAAFLAMALRCFANGLPVVGSCSAVVVGDGDGDDDDDDDECSPATALLPLQWGVVRKSVGAAGAQPLHSLWHHPVSAPKHSMTLARWAQVTRRDLVEVGLLRRLEPWEREVVRAMEEVGGVTPWQVFYETGAVNGWVFGGGGGTDGGEEGMREVRSRVMCFGGMELAWELAWECVQGLCSEDGGGGGLAEKIKCGGVA